MTDITTRLRSIYVAEGANYVGEAADLIDKLRAESDRARHYRSAEFADITAERDGWKSLAEQRNGQMQAMVNDVHSCSHTCVRAGCVNVRLREALKVATDWLVDDVCPLGWTVDRLRAALKETK
jgi:hypothetical protein